MPWSVGKWRYSSTILDCGTGWKWMVSFTPRLLYFRGNRPPYPLGRRLDVPQSRSGHCGVEKSLAHTRNRTPSIQPVAVFILYREAQMVGWWSVKRWKLFEIKRSGTKWETCLEGLRITTNNLSPPKYKSGALLLFKLPRSWPIPCTHTHTHTHAYDALHTIYIADDFWMYVTDSKLSALQMDIRPTIQQLIKYSV
jgi:hypothetical protein